MLLLKSCIYCGKVFISMRKDKLFCTRNCKYKSYNEQLRYIRKNSWGRRRCIVCGKDIVPVSNKHIHCSNRCRVVAHRNRIRLISKIPIQIIPKDTNDSFNNFYRKYGIVMDKQLTLF